MPNFRRESQNSLRHLVALKTLLGIIQNPLVKEIIKNTTDEISKGVALSGQKILTNAAQEIPGAGAVIAAGKIADNIGETG